MGERRINIRVEEELFRALDRKRFENGTSFQQIGIDLLCEWLQRASTAHPKDRGKDPIGTSQESVILRESDVRPGTEVSEASEAFLKDYERASEALLELKARFDEVMESFVSSGETPPAARKPAVGDGSEARRRGKGNTGSSGKRG